MDVLPKEAIALNQATELDQFRVSSQAFARAYCQLQLKADTHRKNLQAVSRDDDRFHKIVEMMPGGVVLLDQAGLIEYANPAAEDLLGYPLCGQAWLNIIERAFAPHHDDGHEISLLDGRLLHLSTRSLEGYSGQLIMLTDATATRNLQEQRHRDQRLTSLGRMVAALAHQIKTPLAAATLYAGHLQQPALSLDKYARFAQKVSTQLRTIDRQIKDMLVFAGGDVRLSERVLVEGFIEDLDESVQFALRESDIGYVLRDCDDASAEIICNQDVLREALINIVNNAVEAQGVNALSIDVVIDSASKQLRIIMQDDGLGISDSASIALTEPFHSTKSHGTGLGLAVVRAVVSAHSGTVNFKSAAGEGLTVVIDLPLVNAVSQGER